MNKWFWGDPEKEELTLYGDTEPVSKIRGVMAVLDLGCEAWLGVCQPEGESGSRQRAEGQERTRDA